MLSLFLGANKCPRVSFRNFKDSKYYIFGTLKRSFIFVLDSFSERKKKLPKNRM